MPKFKHQWKPEIERMYASHDAEKVANEIYSLGDNPTNAQIVDKARDAKTELHGMFEWRDDVAAEKYRETQAHKIVTSLQVIDIGLNGGKAEAAELKPVKLFHHVNGQPGYTTIQKIMNDSVMREQLLQQAYNELRAFERKYSTLEELQPIFDLIP